MFFFVCKFFRFFDFFFINGWDSLIFKISRTLWMNLIQIQIYNLFSKLLTTNIYFLAKKIIFTIAQPRKLRNMLVQANSETKTILKSPKLIGLFLCNNCVYHKPGEIIPCSSFSFKLNNWKTIVLWTNKNDFSCDSKDALF